jgi:hypothetical protein
MKFPVQCHTLGGGDFLESAGEARFDHASSPSPSKGGHGTILQWWLDTARRASRQRSRIRLKMISAQTSARLSPMGPVEMIDNARETIQIVLVWHDTETRPAGMGPA